MKKCSQLLIVLIACFTCFANSQGQPTSPKNVNLAELIGKSSLEIDQIYGKPKSVGEVSKKRPLPVAIEPLPEQFHFYKLENLNLVVYFYKNKPILFQISFRTNKQPESVGDAFTMIGVDKQGRALTEDKIDPLHYSSPIKPHTQKWEAYINQEKCRKIEVWLTDAESFQISKGRQTKRRVNVVWIAVPTSK